MFPLILSMSFCGSIVFVFYLLVRPFAQKYFHVRWRYRILKLSLMFYLVPFPKLKFFLLARIFRIFPEARIWHLQRLYQIDMNKHIFVAERKTWIPQEIRLIMLCLLVTGSITILMICIRWSRYCKLKRFYLDNCFAAESENLDKIVTQVSRKLKVKKKIPLYFSPFVDSPVTIGVFTPRILLPVSMKADMPENEQFYLVTHELNHIKSQDVAVRFLALLATAVHWFNPLCYLLHRELCEVSEYQCDACTLTGIGDPQRVEYSNLLVRLATEFPLEHASSYAAHLVNQDNDLIERRIIEMKRSKEKRKAILPYILGGLICMAGAIPAFAYTPPMIYEPAEKAEALEQLTISEIQYHGDFDMDSMVIPMPYEYFWQGEDGSIIPLDDTTEPESREACLHEYRSGTTSKHTRYSDNSCKVVVRECKICSLCGRKVEGSIISTTNYTVCPH